MKDTYTKEIQGLLPLLSENQLRLLLIAADEFYKASKEAGRGQPPCQFTS